MLCALELREQSQVTITQADPACLVDIQSVEIPPELPQPQRVARAAEQLGNPYCFRSGDTPVRVRFVRESRSLTDALTHYLAQLGQR